MSIVLKNSRIHRQNPLWKFIPQRILLAIVTLMLLSTYSVAYSKETSTLQNDINKSKLIIKTHESELKKNQQAQKETNSKINEITKKILVLDKQINSINSEKNIIESEISEIENNIVQEKQKLNQLLKKIYLMGKNSTLKIFFNKEDPNINDRFIVYSKYITEQRKQYIQNIKAKHELLEVKKADLAKKNNQLLVVNNEYQDFQNQLKIQKNNEKDYENKITKELQAERLKCQEMTQSLKQLEREIEKNRLALQKKKQEEAKRRAQEKAQAIAKEKEEKQRNTNIAHHDKKDNQNNQDKNTNNNSNIELRNINAYKGNLSWPTIGSVIHSFGELRSGDITWKGLVISASRGNSVKAIANADVIYAGWLNGLGNIIVLDHGFNYYSIYGNNDSLLVKAGDKVAANQTISKVGNSGSFSTNSLYFEIRYQGISQNPRSWLRKNKR